MTASAEKPEYVRIYEEIKRRQAEYEAEHPGRYYLLNEYEMDDIDSYNQIECFKRMTPLPPKPRDPNEKSLLQACLECGWIDARPEWQRQGLTKPPSQE